MDFKVLISCEKCKCSFELRPEAFKNYEQLKAGVIALGNVPECIETDTGTAPNGSLFTVRVKSYGMMHDLFGASEN